MNRLMRSPVAKENAPPTMSTANLSAMYSQVIKLSTENKINVKNSWALPLIDHMDHLLQPEDQEELNFQRASCTLDASVKIYSYRVDDTWTASYRVLESLNRTNNQAGGAADADSDSEEASGTKRKAATRGKRAAGGSTLENNRANLLMKQLDLEFDVDPLFHKMSQTFDEGGARGMLLVNLPVRPGCELVFESCDAPLESSHPNGDQTSSDSSLGPRQDAIAAAALQPALPANPMEASRSHICPGLEELYGDLERTGQRLQTALETEAAAKGMPGATKQCDPCAAECGRKGRGAKSRQEQEKKAKKGVNGATKAGALLDSEPGSTAAAAWAREEAAVAAEVGGDPLGWDWSLDAGDDWWTNGGGIMTGGFHDDRLLDEIASPRRSAVRDHESPHRSSSSFTPLATGAGGAGGVGFDDDTDDMDGVDGPEWFADDGDDDDMPSSQRPDSLARESSQDVRRGRGSGSAEIQAAELARVFHAAGGGADGGDSGGMPSAAPASQVQYLDARKLALISRLGGGPRHWKMPRQSTQSTEGAGHSSAGKRKKTTASKKSATNAAAGAGGGNGKSKLVLLDFSEAPPSVDDIRLQPPAGRASTQQSKASVKRAADAGPTAYLLPPSDSMTPESFVRMFLRPGETAESRQGKFVAQQGLGGCEMESAAGGEEWPVTGGMEMDDGDYDAGFCDDDGADAGDAMFPSIGPVGDPSGSALSQWVAAAPKVNRVDVAFARKAKRVDVRRLKRDVWRHIRAHAPFTKHEESDDGEEAAEDVDGDENEPEHIAPREKDTTGPLTFRDMVGSLASSTPRGVTVPFYFITVLHLANENNLTLEPADTTLKDFAIQRN